MKSAYALGFLGTLALVAGGATSCGSSSAGGGTPAAPVTDTAGVDTYVPATDSTPGTETDPGDTAASGDTCTGGTAPTAVVCPSVLASGSLVDQLTPSTKKTAKDSGMKLTGVVATSPKFRVSMSKAGTCLYGVFVADANTTFVPYSGILVVSKGNEAVKCGSSSFCTDGDLIPKDTQPGDTFDITGTYTEFGPAEKTCSGATPPVAAPIPAAQPQLASICALTKTGTGKAPAPAVVPAADIKSGNADLAKWAGGLVTVQSVEAASATSPSDKTSFGKFTLKDSGLTVSNVIYYRGSSTSPTVAVGDKFTQITGVTYLDFCTWSLAPRTICDHTPIPGGDPSKCGGGGDAGVSDAATTTDAASGD